MIMSMISEPLPTHFLIRTTKRIQLHNSQLKNQSQFVIKHGKTFECHFNVIFGYVPA